MATTSITVVGRVSVEKLNLDINGYSRRTYVRTATVSRVFVWHGPAKAQIKAKSKAET